MPILLTSLLTSPYTLAPSPARTSSHLHHTAFFIGSNTREAVGAGRADFLPIVRGAHCKSWIAATAHPEA